MLEKKICTSMRKFSTVIYKIVEALSNRYNIVVDSLKDDLNITVCNDTY